MSEKITNIIISSAAPLSTTMQALTGKSWNAIDFETIGHPSEHMFVERGTGRKFKHYKVEEAKEEGITGIQIPTESTVKDFWEKAEKEGPNQALNYYLKNNLLTANVVDSLYGGYATGSTWQEHYDLLRKNAATSFRLSYKKGGVIEEQNISFKYKGHQHSFSFTPEDIDWWTAFESHGLVFDVHYDEPNHDIDVYEVINNKANMDTEVYRKKIFDSSLPLTFYVKDKNGKQLFKTKSANQASDFYTTITRKEKKPEDVSLIAVDSNGAEKRIFAQGGIIKTIWNFLNEKVNF